MSAVRAERGSRAPRPSAGRRELLWAALGFCALLLLLVVLAWLVPSAHAGGAAAAPPAVAGARAEDARLALESFDWIWATVRDKHYDPTLGGLDWQAVRDTL